MSQARKAQRVAKTPAANANLELLAGKLNDALAVVECAAAALENAEVENPGTHVLGLGINQLKALHRELDEVC